MGQEAQILLQTHCPNGSTLPIPRISHMHPGDAVSFGIPGFFLGCDHPNGREQCLGESLVSTLVKDTALPGFFRPL